MRKYRKDSKHKKIDTCKWYRCRSQGVNTFLSHHIVFSITCHVHWNVVFISSNVKTKTKNINLILFISNILHQNLYDGMIVKLWFLNFIHLGKPCKVPPQSNTWLRLWNRIKTTKRWGFFSTVIFNYQLPHTSRVLWICEKSHEKV